MTKIIKIVKKDPHMPKIYSEDERNQIIAKLKSEANILLQEKGVKKTTVDELVKKAGISKGTFYLFYPSKEMLLFNCVQDFHEKADAYLTQGMNDIIKKHKLDPDKKGAFGKYADEVTDVIMGAIDITRNSCLRVALEPEAMGLILSKIPEDILKKHREHDKSAEEGIFEALAMYKGINAEELTGAFTMVHLGGMYKQVIGEENLDGSTRLLVKGLVLQMVG